MKPRVHCELVGLHLVNHEGATVAFIRRLSDHPKLGPPRTESSTRTSMILNIDFRKKEFETLNTVYYWS